jgi:hypothetical protein
MEFQPVAGDQLWQGRCCLSVPIRQSGEMNYLAGHNDISLAANEVSEAFNCNN